MSTRKFHIGDVLGIVLSRTLSPKGNDGLRDIASFVKGERIVELWNVFSEDLRQYLRKEFPQFTTPEMESEVKVLARCLALIGDEDKKQRDIVMEAWLKKQIHIHKGVPNDGMLEVRPMS